MPYTFKVLIIIYLRKRTRITTWFICMYIYRMKLSLPQNSIYK